MTKTILIVHHPRSESSRRLRDGVMAGIGAAVGDGGADVGIVDLPAPDADISAVEAADGLILVTPANFGAVSGLVKDFLERIYPWFEESPSLRPGLPYGLIAKGASDASGAVRDVTRIVTGLRWKEVVAPLELIGDLTDAHLAASREVGATLAAGVDAGLW